MNACIDCKHFNAGNDNQVYNPHQPYGRPEPQCGHPGATSRDVIYGRALCQSERSEMNKKGCGPKGKLWEPKSAGK